MSSMEHETVILRDLGEAPRSFCLFSYKKEPKFKGLSDSLTLCLRQTSSRCCDQLLLLVNGGHPFCPCLDPPLVMFTTSDT